MEQPDAGEPAVWDIDGGDVRKRSVRFDDETGTHYHYDHGANGRVMTVQDYSPPGRTFVSETDSAGRPVRCVLSSGTSHLYTRFPYKQ